jgi:hypothetical protein
MRVEDIIRKAIEIGERNGSITFEQLNAICDPKEIASEDIERVVNALSEADIHIEEE